MRCRLYSVTPILRFRNWPGLFISYFLPLILWAIPCWLLCFHGKPISCLPTYLLIFSTFRNNGERFLWILLPFWFVSYHIESPYLPILYQVFSCSIHNDGLSSGNPSRFHLKSSTQYFSYLLTLLLECFLIRWRITMSYCFSTGGHAIPSSAISLALSMWWTIAIPPFYYVSFLCLQLTTVVIL
jgi:hypothetical protein